MPTMKTFLMIINIVALICTGMWLATDRSWESLAAFLVLLSSFFILIKSGRKITDAGKIKMRQRGGKNSKNYQSGGDMNINQ